MRMLDKGVMLRWQRTFYGGRFHLVRDDGNAVCGLRVHKTGLPVEDTIGRSANEFQRCATCRKRVLVPRDAIERVAQLLRGKRRTAMIRGSVEMNTDRLTAAVVAIACSRADQIGRRIAEQFGGLAMTRTKKPA